MTCQRECIDCGSTDNVRFVKDFEEFYCDGCEEMIRFDSGVKKSAKVPRFFTKQK